jgi:hypothetical protein
VAFGMLRTFQAVHVALALAGSSLAACAVTGASTAPRCSVTGTEMLRADAGGQQAICAEIDRAMTAAPPGTRVEVRIHSASFVSARTILSDGRTLPEMNTAVSDSTLGKSSFAMLARALAEQLAAAR